MCYTERPRPLSTVTQVLGRAPTVGQSVLCIEAAIGHCQQKAASQQHGVVLVLGWQFGHLAHCRLVAVFDVFAHQHLFRVDVNFHAAWKLGAVLVWPISSSCFKYPTSYYPISNSHCPIYCAISISLLPALNALFPFPKVLFQLLNALLLVQNAWYSNYFLLISSYQIL